MTIRLALTNCLALGLALAIAAGCRESPVVPFSYPPSWPIVALKVPPGASQINVPDGQGGTSDKLLLDGELLQAGTRFEHRDWQVAFTCQRDDQELVSFFDELLRIDNFLLWHPGVPKYGKRVYITKDNKQQVSFEWRDTQRQADSGKFKGYVLTISVFTESQIDISGVRPIPAHGKAPADKWAF
jgi:hypothetical protein